MQTFCLLPLSLNRNHLLGLRISLLTLHRKFSVKPEQSARVKKKARLALAKVGFAPSLFH
jgi:hypothetical protein